MTDQDRRGEGRDRHRDRDRDEGRERWGGRGDPGRGGEDRHAGAHGGRTGRDRGHRDEDHGRHGTGGAGREGYGREGHDAPYGRGSDPRGYGGEDRREGYGRGGYAGGGGYGQGGGDSGRGMRDRATDEVSPRFGGEQAARRWERDHRGRGPRGYRRSDERIREDVSDRLCDDRYVDASDIDVSVGGGEVTLGGAVDSREARRRAEIIAEGVSGVTHVQNNLRVGRRAAPPSGGLAARADVGAASPEDTTSGASGAGADVGGAAAERRATAAPPAAGPEPGAAAPRPTDREAAGQARAPAVRTVAALFDTPGAANRAADHLAGLGIADVAVAAAEGGAAGGVSAPGPGGGGGIWEALAGVLMPEEDRHAYAEGVRRGGVLLTATVGEAMADEAVRVLGRAGAVDLEARSGEWRASGWRGRAAGGDDAGAEGGAERG
jgi:osmotically-inducible protein OsmY